MLRLLYAAGLRVSELCNLHWRDLQARSEGEDQINVYGKGGKTQVVLLPATSWRELVSLYGKRLDLTSTTIWPCHNEVRNAG